MSFLKRLTELADIYMRRHSRLTTQAGTLVTLKRKLVEDLARAREWRCPDIVVRTVARQLKDTMEVANKVQQDVQAVTDEGMEKLKDNMARIMKWSAENGLGAKASAESCEKLRKLDERAAKGKALLLASVREADRQGLSPSCPIMKLESLDKLARQLVATVKDRKAFDQQYDLFETFLASILDTGDDKVWNRLGVSHSYVYPCPPLTEPTVSKHLLCIRYHRDRDPGLCEVR
jgi:hypothetical protein